MLRSGIQRIVGSPGRSDPRDRKETLMSTAVVGQPGRRSFVPGLSLMVAAGAAVLGVVAIVTDDDAAPAPPVETVRADQMPSTDSAVGGLPMVLPRAGEPCGLRIRGNLPC
jgi:hypothetical protein